MTPNKLPPLPVHVSDAINELAAWANSDGDEVIAGTKRAEDSLRQQIIEYGRTCAAEALRQSQSSEYDKAADDLRAYGSSFMLDGKRIHPADVFIVDGQSKSLPAWRWRK